MSKRHNSAAPGSRGDRGFSLVELVLVISVVGVIAGTIMAGVSAVLGNEKSTMARLSEQRTIQGFATWLPADVASTPPGGLSVGGSPVCGSGGTQVLGMQWSENVDGSVTTYRVSYQAVDVNGETHVRRHVCAGGATSTSTLATDLPAMGGGWTPTSPPIQISYDAAARTVTVVLTQRNGDTVSLRADQYNPAETLPPPPPPVVLPPPPHTGPATTSTTTPPTTTTTSTTIAPTTTVGGPTTTDGGPTTTDGGTTLPPTTTLAPTTTLPPTTTTTIPPCAVTSLVVVPNPVQKKSNDQLKDSATVTVTTTGPCVGLVLRYTPGSPALKNITMSGGPNTWTAVLPKNSDRWYGVGPQELRVMMGTLTVLWSYNAFEIRL